MRASPHSAESIALLRKALKHRSSAVVAKAARITAEAELRDLGPDVVHALDRLLASDAAQDRGCTAKLALAGALRAIEHFDTDLFRRGIARVQREPTWGGTVDTAAALRATCALALVDARDSDALLLAVDLAADQEPQARIGAVKALGASGRPEALLALRMKAHAGDADPEVIAECLTELLALDRNGSFAFVARFLASPDPVRVEAAALALAATREARALDLLRPVCRDSADAALRKSIFGAIAAMRTDEAFAFLIDTVRQGRLADAIVAIEALAASRVEEGIARRAAEAMARRGNSELTRAARAAGLTA